MWGVGGKGISGVEPFGNAEISLLTGAPGGEDAPVSRV
jgi:hypothetical protein